jgi:glucose-1-phosphate adenylyltransferase
MLGRYRGISMLPPYIGSEQENWYRGSADAVFRNLDFVQYHDPEQVLVLSGDHIYKMDYQHMIAYHREKDADLTIGVIRVKADKAHRFGIAAVDDEDGDTGWPGHGLLGKTHRAAIRLGLTDGPLLQARGDVQASH